MKSKPIDERYKLVIKTVDGSEHIIPNLKEHKADNMLEDLGIFDWISLVTDSGSRIGKIKLTNIVSVYKRFDGRINE